MLLLDDLVEQHIQAALARGEFDNLPHQGQPLELADLSMVPKELRAGYIVLKNAGYIPAELEQRKEALTLQKMLREVAPNSIEHNTLNKKFLALKLKLELAGINTAFLATNYATKLQQQMT